LASTEALSYMPFTDQHLSSLRRRIAAGDYAVNANNVAGTIVRKLWEINRARRLIDDAEGDRTQKPAGSTRQAPEARRPRHGPSAR